MEKSYSIIYQGDIKDAFEKNGIDKYMILNEQLAVIYDNDKIKESKLSRISEISWYQEASPMSSLIQIKDGVKGGETVISATGADFIENNPYITVNGEGVMVAIIDSGIDYLHPDFIRDDNTSKIISIWDQEGNINPPPEGMIFGSEFTREDLNKAIIENDASLTVDDIGTGTIAGGIIVGEGNLNKSYQGAAPNAELVVVKLREYEDTYSDGKINYMNTDFLAAIKYVIDVSKREKKLTIINLTIGERSRSIILTNLL
ncbi:MAG: S8 family serine peptidase, partial [Peptostreptococcaceae bacterium]